MRTRNQKQKLSDLKIDLDKKKLTMNRQKPPFLHSKNCVAREGFKARNSHARRWQTNADWPTEKSRQKRTHGQIGQEGNDRTSHEHGLGCRKRNKKQRGAPEMAPSQRSKGTREIPLGVKKLVRLNEVTSMMTLRRKNHSRYSSRYFPASRISSKGRNGKEEDRR